MTDDGKDVLVKYFSFAAQGRSNFVYFSLFRGFQLVYVGSPRTDIEGLHLLAIYKKKKLGQGNLCKRYIFTCWKIARFEWSVATWK